MQYSFPQIYKHAKPFIKELRHCKTLESFESEWRGRLTLHHRWFNPKGIPYAIYSACGVYVVYAKLPGGQYFLTPKEAEEFAFSNIDDAVDSKGVKHQPYPKKTLPIKEIEKAVLQEIEEQNRIREKEAEEYRKQQEELKKRNAMLRTLTEEEFAQWLKDNFDLGGGLDSYLSGMKWSLQSLKKYEEKFNAPVPKWATPSAPKSLKTSKGNAVISLAIELGRPLPKEIGEFQK